MAKSFSAIRQTVRQILKDEFVSGTDYDFQSDELDIHIEQARVEVSQACPYEYRETVVSDGTIEIDLSDIKDLIGDKVEKIEYPTGNNPPDYIHDFSIFGNTLTLNTGSAPTSGDNIYLYCHKVHSLTESASTLTLDLEKVLVEGAVAKAAQSWLNKMRKQIVPTSSRWYHDWANSHLLLYRSSLDSITPAKSWEY
jgi:hypothetical protein